MIGWTRTSVKPEPQSGAYPSRPRPQLGAGIRSLTGKRRVTNPSQQRAIPANLEHPTGFEPVTDRLPSDCSPQRATSAKPLVCPRRSSQDLHPIGEPGTQLGLVSGLKPEPPGYESGASSFCHTSKTPTKHGAETGTRTRVCRLAACRTSRCTIPAKSWSFQDHRHCSLAPPSAIPVETAEPRKDRTWMGKRASNPHTTFRSA